MQSVPNFVWTLLAVGAIAMAIAVAMGILMAQATNKAIKVTPSILAALGKGLWRFIPALIEKVGSWRSEPAHVYTLTMFDRVPDETVTVSVDPRYVQSKPPEGESVPVKVDSADHSWRRMPPYAYARRFGRDKVLGRDLCIGDVLKGCGRVISIRHDPIINDPQRCSIQAEYGLILLPFDNDSAYQMDQLADHPYQMRECGKDFKYSRLKRDGCVRRGDLMIGDRFEGTSKPITRMHYDPKSMMVTLYDEEGARPFFEITPDNQNDQVRIVKY